MDWLEKEVPQLWQWIGLFATLIGSVLALWAAVSATGAKRQATAARDSATRLGYVLQLSDLVLDMQELQTMLARHDYEAVAAKASHLRGRIVRFKTQAYNSIREDDAQNLDVARDQLEIIGRVASDWRGKPENRPGRIQIAFAAANEALNRVFGFQQLQTQGE